MKKFFLTLLTILVVVILFAAAICIGSVKDFKNDREEILRSCAEMHTTGRSLEITIERCEEAADRFDDRLVDSMLGVVALGAGVEPVWEEVNDRHEQLLEAQTYESIPNLGDEITALLDEHVDTSMSFTKVVLTVIFLIVIFGPKGRKRGFTLGKLFAGFGLFKLWKKK